MAYKSLDQEWDDTWNGCLNPLHVGDKVLCSTLEVQAGEVVEVHPKGTIDQYHYTVRLEDGSVDKFAADDVLKRKLEAAA